MLNFKVREGDILDLVMERDKEGNSQSKRVVVHNILENNTKKDRRKVVLIVWKSGFKIEEKENSF